LPVAWCSFIAEVEKGRVVLTWATQTEVNNDYFSVERSADGQDFIEIARIKGEGESKTKKTYKTIDHFPLQGISYYRLAQTDFDGSVRYSKVIVVRADVGMAGLAEYERFLFFPNPVSRGDKLMLLLDPAASGGRYPEVRITDITGAVCDLPVTMGRNGVTVDTGRLQRAGMYLLFIESEEGTVVRKLIVK
jgi:hypothetical protein